MRMVAVGREREVTGFALAGVETAVCEPGDDAGALLARLAAADAGVGLLIVSASTGRAAAATMQKLRRRRGPPVIAELPHVVDEGAP